MGPEPRLSELAAAMRAGGARVGVGELLAAHRALAAVDASDRRNAFYALRAALCSSRAELGVFADAFAAVFAASPDEVEDPLAALGRIERAALPRIGVPHAEIEVPAEVDVPVPAAYSDEELLRDKDFAHYTDAERALARRLLARIAARAPQRLSRRTRPTRRRRDTHDLRATVRASLRHGGELMERRYREPGVRARRVVLVCDVSGSMAPYARMLMQYLQASVAAHARGGGVRVRHAAHARDPRPRRPRSRPRAPARRRSRDRLVGRHADRRGDRPAQPRARPPDRARRRRGRAVRRLGPRRPRRARRRDGAAAPHRAPAPVAQPAGRRPALRAAHPRHGGRAAARRPPAAGQLARIPGIPGRARWRKDSS